MAGVNRYGDIPGGITSEGTCRKFESACDRAISKLSNLSQSYSDILTIVSQTSSSLELIISNNDSVKGNFERNAYNDGQCEYISELATNSTDLNNIKADLDRLIGELNTAVSEIGSLLNFCGERKDTWRNAADFIHKQKEYEQSLI